VLVADFGHCGPRYSKRHSASWLDSVAPIITAKEKKTYLSLKPVERMRFEENFWADKPITAEEYFQRLQ